MAPDAEASAVRRAYLELARRHHPDAHAGSGADALARAERRMQQINDAWAVIGDPQQRFHYDRERSSDVPTTPEVMINRPGKGTWTPRSGDDSWMEDFAGWAHGDPDFVPPDRPRTPVQQTFTVLPVVLFGLSLVVGFVGLAINARPLIAVAFVGVMLSVMTLFLLTMTEMRGRNRR